MRKLHNSGQDSLDLLLDTLCNVFGAIILIACLLALLGRDQTASHSPVNADAGAVGLLLEHRIDAALSELDGLQKLLSEIDDAGDKPLRELAAKRDVLRKTVDRLRKERSDSETQAIQKATAHAADPGTELARLSQRRKELAMRLADLQLQAEAASEKQQFLENRLIDLAREIEGSESTRHVKLRLPKERSSTKHPAAIILKFGEVFPISDGEGHYFDGVRHSSETGDSFIVHPKNSEGLSPSRNASSLREIFARHQSSNSYLAFYIYPDSFEAFRELKPLIHQLGIEYGVHVCIENEVLAFGSKGTSPAPL